MATPNAPKSPTDSYLVSYPAPYTMLVTLNRPQAMNCLPSYTHWELEDLWLWYDNEPSLRIAIVTGAGKKAFCAGQDLIEQGTFKNNPPHRALRSHPKSGFAGISKRVGKKPIIAAVNGFALGGGMEIVLNCDMIVASPNASFGLPEVSVGLYAAAGGLPRIVRNIGLPLASEMALTGRRITAKEALDYHLINKIAASQDTLIKEAVELAEKVTQHNPDAVIVTRAGLREAWETASVEQATQKTAQRWDEPLFTSPNMAIGLKAFATKTKPKWVPSKL